MSHEFIPDIIEATKEIQRGIRGNEPERPKDNTRDDFYRSLTDYIQPPAATGLKYDGGKLRWDLLPMEEVEEIVKILTFGSKKYTDNSWQDVPKGVERYYAALLRHLVNWRKGKDNDDESGFRHLAHAACNIVFLLYLTRKK